MSRPNARRNQLPVDGRSRSRPASATQHQSTRGQLPIGESTYLDIVKGAGIESTPARATTSRPSTARAGPSNGAPSTGHPGNSSLNSMDHDTLVALVLKLQARTSGFEVLIDALGAEVVSMGEDYEQMRAGMNMVFKTLRKHQADLGFLEGILDKLPASLFEFEDEDEVEAGDEVHGGDEIEAGDEVEAGAKVHAADVAHAVDEPNEGEKPVEEEGRRSTRDQDLDQAEGVETGDAA